MATLRQPSKLSESPRVPREIEVPAPTAWPLVLAFGFTLIFAGLLTSASVSVLGAVLAAGRLRRLVPRSLPSRARRGGARGSRGHSRHHRAPDRRAASGCARSWSAPGSRSRRIRYRRA